MKNKKLFSSSQIIFTLCFIYHNKAKNAGAFYKRVIFAINANVWCYQVHVGGNLLRADGVHFPKGKRRITWKNEKQVFLDKMDENFRMTDHKSRQLQFVEAL